jgi:hypothetical protein
MDVSVSLQLSSDDTLESWTGMQRDLIRFKDGYKAEPECPQMFKLGNRWYLLASLARRTNNYVGCPSYWIGDAGKTTDDVDYSSKTEMRLEGEDLCAAQVAFDGSQLRIFGWIPASATGGVWGGALSLPRTVYAGAGGTLYVKLDSDIESKIKGRQLESVQNKKVSKDSSVTFTGKYNRFNLTISATIGNSTALIKAAGNVVKLDGANNKLLICRESDGYIYSSYSLPDGALDGISKIHLVAEGDILELFVNDKWSLCARTDSNLKNASVKVAAGQGTFQLNSGSIWRLKYLEEII